jgi:hypothetical protein
MSQGRQGLPGFLCIGAQKAATSWFARVLSEHPDVWIPPTGEPHYFDRHGRPPRRRVRRLAERRGAPWWRDLETTGGPALVSWADRVVSHPSVTLEWYQDLFTDPLGSRLGGDVTPAYLGMDRDRVASARRLLGDLPVVVIVRSPLDRELSQLRMWATHPGLGLALPVTEQEWTERYRLMVERAPRGGYTTGLPVWEEAFSRVLPLAYGDVRERPEELIATVERHIGVSHYDGHRGLRERVHVSGRAEIPESVVAAARDRVVHEEQFLQARFDADFLARTR